MFWFRWGDYLYYIMTTIAVPRTHHTGLTRTGTAFVFRGSWANQTTLAQTEDMRSSNPIIGTVLAAAPTFSRFCHCWARLAHPWRLKEQKGYVRSLARGGITYGVYYFTQGTNMSIATKKIFRGPTFFAFRWGIGACWGDRVVPGERERGNVPVRSHVAGG